MRRVLVGCVRTSTCDILRPCNNQIRPSGLLKQKALPAGQHILNIAFTVVLYPIKPNSRSNTSAAETC